MYKKSFLVCVGLLLAAVSAFIALRCLYCCSQEELFQNILYSVLTGSIVALPGGIFALFYSTPIRRLEENIYRLCVALQEPFRFENVEEFELCKARTKETNLIISEIRKVRNQSCFTNNKLIDEILLYAAKTAIPMNTCNSDEKKADYAVVSREIEKHRKECLKCIDNYNNGISIDT